MLQEDLRMLGFVASYQCSLMGLNGSDGFTVTLSKTVESRWVAASIPVSRGCHRTGPLQLGLTLVYKFPSMGTISPGSSITAIDRAQALILRLLACDDAIL